MKKKNSHRLRKLGLRSKIYRKLKAWAKVDEGQKAPWFLLAIRVILFPFQSYVQMHSCPGVHYNFASHVYMFDLPGKRGSIIITGEELEKFLEGEWTTQYLYDPSTIIAIDDGDFRSFPDMQVGHPLKEKEK